MKIHAINLYHVNLPLITPYALSYRTFESFEPFMLELQTDNGRTVWGEQHISPGSSKETREFGWEFLRMQAASSIGLEVEDVYEKLNQARLSSPVAATAFLNALDQILTPERCSHSKALQIPVLSAFSAQSDADIEEELDRKLSAGFKTFKIKVGRDVQADRKRVSVIQRILGSRGHIRVDANRAYAVEDAIAFCNILDPAICELFEQPCDSDDWDGNGQVAACSPVPLMLDEPICHIHDIERAASMAGIGFCKVKLKRFGSIVALEEAIEAAHQLGLGVILGDGLGSDINCYLEALVSSRHLDRAGEFNGCLKISDDARITTHPIGFFAGDIIIPDHFKPEPDPQRLMAHTLNSEKFS